MSLFDLYCYTAIGGAYSKSTFPHISDSTDALASEDILSRSSGTVCSETNGMTMPERNRSYDTALISYWVALETPWVTRTEAWESVETFKKVRGLVCDQWTDNPKRPLQEKIDVEVVDFVWIFLGRKFFPMSSVPLRLEGEIDRVFWLLSTRKSPSLRTGRGS